MSARKKKQMLFVYLRRHFDKPCAWSCRRIAFVIEDEDAGRLVCAGCHRHRGWITKSAAQSIKQIYQTLGTPEELPVLRDETALPGGSAPAITTEIATYGECTYGYGQRLLPE